MGATTRTTRPAVKPALYLDTARLGQMSPRARRAMCAFTRLVAEEPCSSRFDDFLERGFTAWPRPLQERYEALSDWEGIAGLKQSLRRRAEQGEEFPVFLANRSSQLMRLAARLLFQRCRRVLTTDLEWPAYRAILEQERQRAGGTIIQIGLWSAIFNDRISAEEVAETCAREYAEKKCEGVFLSGVTYHGVRFPVRQLVDSLAIDVKPPFVVVDGAQEFCHAPSSLATGKCDLYIAGCHKWLRAYQPMGLGFCGRENSQGVIADTCRRMIAEGELDDALLPFTNRREAGHKDRFTETVSLMGLFSCAAALKDSIVAAPVMNNRFLVLVKNAELFRKLARTTDWSVLSPDTSLRSSIVLLYTENPEIRIHGPAGLRHFFQSLGVALTVYEGSIVRLSAPDGAWRQSDGNRLRSALDGSSLLGRFRWPSATSTDTFNNPLATASTVA